MVCDTGASAGAGWMEGEAVRPRPALSSTRLNVAQTASALTNGLCSSVRSTTRSGSMTKPTFSFHFRSLRITVPYLYVTSIRSTQSWHRAAPRAGTTSRFLPGSVAHPEFAFRNANGDDNVPRISLRINRNGTRSFRSFDRFVATPSYRNRLMKQRLLKSATGEVR